MSNGISLFRNISLSVKYPISNDFYKESNITELGFTSLCTIFASIADISISFSII